ncbi:hypothetical protein BGZ98_005754, partial [Dissophora globulifera]
MFRPFFAYHQQCFLSQHRKLFHDDGQFRLSAAGGGYDAAIEAFIGRDLGPQYVPQSRRAGEVSIIILVLPLLAPAAVVTSFTAGHVHSGHCLPPDIVEVTGYYATPHIHVTARRAELLLKMLHREFLAKLVLLP